MIAAPAAPGLRIVTPETGVRFLGLTATERHDRLAARVSGALAGSPTLPVLEVPPGAIVTLDAIAALPPAGPVQEIVWAEGRPPMIWRAADAGQRRADRIPRVPDGTVLDISTASGRRRAAWRLLRASGKPTDGGLSRHVHRRVSRIFSYALLQLGVSPNVATFLVFGVGVVSAWLMAQTSHATMIAGGFLLWFASIADGIDGEMARLTMSESAFGEQLDTAVDHATHLMAYVGVVIGWWRQGFGAWGAALVVAVGLGIPAVLLWAMAIVRRARHLRDQWFVDTKPIEFGVFGLAATSRAPLLRGATAIWVLFRREAFSLTFFLVALVTGRRAVYPLLVAVTLAYVSLVFSVYGMEIEQAIQSRDEQIAQGLA